MSEQTWALRVSEDLAPSGGRYALAALNRVLYVCAGALTVTRAAQDVEVAAAAVWHGGGACTVAAGPAGAAVLRWEVVRAGALEPRLTGVATRVLLEHPLDLDPRAPWLMRCDRVDFAPGGVAFPHRHRGGGIRCLVAGTLDVTVGHAPARRMTPGSAWFESGREPVLAVSSKDAPTSFIRVSILPREIRGQSSIMYVDPRDAERGRPRKYTVYADEPIELA